MSYLKEIKEFYDKRWQEVKKRAKQFFETYFTSTDVSPQQNQSSNSSQCIIDIEEYSKKEPRKRKGFTPEAREALIERLKASGHTVMTADGRIDLSTSRYKSDQGSFRRAR